MGKNFKVLLLCKGLFTSQEGFSGEADIHVKDADTKDNVCEKLNIRLTQKSIEQMLVSLIWRRKISIAHISSNTFLQYFPKSPTATKNLRGYNSRVVYFKSVTGVPGWLRS